MNHTVWLLAAEAKEGCSVPLGVKLPGLGNSVSCSGGIHDYLQAVVTIVEGALGIAIVVAIVISGVQYITSAGSPDAIKSAKSRLGNAVLGLVLYILMIGILKVAGLGGILG